MNSQQQALIDNVKLGPVFDQRAGLDVQISKMATELWHLTDEIARQIGDEWASKTYYDGVIGRLYTHAHIPGYWDNQRLMEDDRDLLFDVMDEFAPPGCYFGPDYEATHLWGFYIDWRNEA